MKNKIEECKQITDKKQSIIFTSDYMKSHSQMLNILGGIYQSNNRMLEEELKKMKSSEIKSYLIKIA